MNLFNALNGKEAKQIIIAEVARALENDGEFREHLTFPRVSWSWRLEMKIYPRTPEEKVVEVAGEAVQMKTEPDPLNPVNFVMSRDPQTGNLMPAVPDSATHVREILQSQVRDVSAPDAVREAEGLQPNAAAPGGFNSRGRIAKSAEVGTAAEKPTYSPGLNR